MPDKWSQYEVKPAAKADRWAQYEERPAAQAAPVAKLQPLAASPARSRGLLGSIADMGSRAASGLGSWADRTLPNTDQVDEWGPEGRWVANAGTRLVRGVLHAPEAIAATAKDVINDPEGAAQRIGPGNIVPMAKQAKGYADTAKTKGFGQATSDLVGDAGAGYVLGKGLGAIAKPVSGALRGTATGMRIAGASTDSLKNAGTRILAPGTAGEVMARGLKPGIQFGPEVPAMIEDTLPEILSQNANPRTVGDFAKAADAAREANQLEYQARISPYERGKGTAPRPSSIDGNKVAQAQIESVPFIEKFENPSSAGQSGWWGGPTAKTSPAGIVDKIADKAKPYRGNLDIPTADRLREGANAKLHSFYNKAKGDRAAALVEPETARYKAVGDNLREQIYPVIDEDYGLTPGSTAGQRQMYGKLADVGDIAGKREIVFGRHDPVSLSAKIVSGHGGPISTVFNFAKDRALKGLTDSDALIRSGVDRFRNPGGVLGSLQPDAGVRGSLFPAGEGVSGLADGLRYASPFAPAALAPLGIIGRPKEQKRKQR